MRDLPHLDLSAVEEVICRALDEDIGSADVTSLWTVPPSAKARAAVIAKAEGVVAGMEVAAAVFRAVDRRILVDANVGDGTRVSPGQQLAAVSGPARGVLTAERTALNFLQRLSGIATMTARYVAAVSGTPAQILDTRKTAPGLRVLDKYAVAAGGGVNHRMGLYDMVLLKENHIVAAGGIAAAVGAAKSASARDGRSMIVEVEVEDLAELEEAISAGADWILLDNMDADAMRRAAERVRTLGPGRPKLEASGNVCLDTVRTVAETGVDLISIGALTHSAPAFDLSMRFQT